MTTAVKEAPVELPEGAKLIKLPDDRSIHERVIAILGELPAIGKDQRNEQQKFMYRGHDDVMNALNPLLAKHGVFFSPYVLKRVTAERTTQRGTTMYEVNLCVRYTFWGAKGDYFEATAWGEGTDSGDKSTNKAMTMALKNVLAQVFALATEELSDADGRSPEETTRGGGAAPAAAPADRSRRRDRDEPFNPGADLLPNAVRGEGYAERLMEIQKSLAPDLDWPAMLDVAATACLGPKSKRTVTQRKEQIVRWSNTIAKLETLAEASGEYVPDLGIKAGEEGDELIRAAFEFGFGYRISGDLPKAEGEKASDAPVESPAPEEPSERDDGDPPGQLPSDEGASSA